MPKLEKLTFRAILNKKWQSFKNQQLNLNTI